jgi:hypothetical protein
MDGTRAVCVALLAVAELGGGCSGKKSEPPPGREAPSASTSPATGARDAGAPGPSPADAAPTEAAAPPDPIASLFRRRYTPDESLPDRMRRRIRYHLRSKTKAPIALHHITYVPQAGSGGDVFAIYEYSAYEDCVLGYADRKEGREKCTGEQVAISDLDHRETNAIGQEQYLDKQVYLNHECVVLGVVRAHFEPPGPDVPADAGGAVTISSAKLDGLCEAHSYNRLFVADLDGDERLELYLDVTTSEEKLNRSPGVRSEPESTSIGHHFDRHLYLFAGDGSSDFALSLGLGDWEDLDLQPQELVELRDLNRDRRLDVIQWELCIIVRSSGVASSDRSCGGKPRRKTEYMYDAARDAWISTQEVSGSAKQPAAGSAKQPAAGGVSPP